MSMKRYAVFAKKTPKAQRKGDYTIWHFLNDSDDVTEATYWVLAARANEDYSDVQLVQTSMVEIRAVLGNE